MVVARWLRTSSRAWVWNPDGKNAVVPWPTKGYWIPPLASDFASFYGWNCEIWGSRDGSDTDAEGGLAIRGQPCVWCGGGLGMPRPTGRFEDRDSVVVRGWLKQPGRSWISFYRHFFLANLSLPGVKDGSIDETYFLKVFSSSSLVSIKDYQLRNRYIYIYIISTFVYQMIKHPRNSESEGSCWDTFKRKKNTAKIHPNAPFFFKLISGKKTPRPCTDESEAKCAPYEYFAHGAGKVPWDGMG